MRCVQERKYSLFSLLSRVKRRQDSTKRAVAECEYGLGHMHAEPSEVKGGWKRPLHAPPARKAPFRDIEQLIQNHAKQRHSDNAREHLRVGKQRPGIHDEITQPR